MTVFVELNPEYDEDPSYITRADGQKYTMAHIYPGGEFEPDLIYVTIPGSANGAYIELADLEAVLAHMGHNAIITPKDPDG